MSVHVNKVTDFVLCADQFFSSGLNKSNETEHSPCSY